MTILTRAVAATLIFVGGARADEDGLTKEQFLRFVKSHQSSIQDVAFAFEGEQWRLGQDGDAPGPFSKYQGRYALRSDGSAYLEHYREYNDDRRDQHIIQATLRGRGEVARIWEGYFDEPNPPVRTLGAGPGSYFGADSPETFQFLWRFQSLKDVSDFGYKFVGWDEVDGHRCAHIEFNPHPNHAGRVLQELWVDLQRGAHPLRIRNSDGRQRVYEIDDIRLGEFALPSGENIWFPIGGRYRKYHHEGDYTREPAGEATTYVLNGTLVFNQGLGDGVFRVKADRFRPAFTPAVANEAKPSNRDAAADLETAEKTLDEALADPSRPALPMDASAASQVEASRWATAGRGLGFLGVAAILVAGVIAWRRAS